MWEAAWWHDADAAGMKAAEVAGINIDKAKSWWSLGGERQHLIFCF